MTKDRLHRIPTIGRGLVLFAAVFAGFFQPTSGHQLDPRREPATAIGEAVRLLERNDHVAFLKAFMRPDELKEMLAKYGTIEDVAAESRLSLTKIGDYWFIRD